MRNMEILVLALLAYLTYRLVRYILKERYFASEDFLARKTEIAAVVAEHNEVTDYV